MLQIALRAVRLAYESDTAFPLGFLVLALTGILVSMYLGIAPPDTF